MVLFLETILLRNRLCVVSHMAGFLIGEELLLIHHQFKVITVEKNMGKLWRVVYYARSTRYPISEKIEIMV